MGESPISALPQLQGLVIEAVEWLPSGADSGLVRVRGRWSAPEASRPGLPELGLRAGDGDHRFESLPDARFARDPASWRGSYLVPAALVAAGPSALWVEWPGGVRSGLPPLAPGLATVEAPAEAAPAVEEPAGGQVIDRAVLAERRARRAEAAEQAQTRVAAEALRAVEALELQSAELERRLADAVAERDAMADGFGAPEPGRDDLERVAERRAAALGSALDSLAGLRAQSRDWRLRLRTSEIAHAGDAVRLAVLEAERSTAGNALRAALHERTQGLEEARRLAEARATELAAASAAAESARVELEEVRAEADRAERRARGERAVHEEVRDELRSRLDAEGARSGALEASHAAEASARAAAEARLAELDATVAELEVALAMTETRLHTATAEAAAASSRLRVESVARAALEDELDRDRDARAGADRVAAERDRLAVELDAARAETARLGAAVEAERAAGAAAVAAERLARAAERDALIVERDELSSAAARELAAQLEAEREARLFLEVDLTAERERRATLEAELAAARAARATPPAPPADPARLGQAAREQAEAAAAAREPANAGLLADLDAAAAALREAAPVLEPEVAAEPEPEPEIPAAAPPRPRPTIVSASGPPPRVHATGRSARDYPALRGALVKLAHDDPATAGRVIAALLPAQAAALGTALDYDLTIEEVGTFSVTVAGTWTHVKPLEAPRGRGDADFHLTAGALTLAELLAGVPRHVGRLFGAARFRGNARRARSLRALAGADLSLSEAVRAGATLDPGLVYRTLAYAVHPSWTRGEHFTVAQQIEGGETWYLTARDGAGLAASELPPEEGVDATVTMSAEAFRLLLRGESLRRGERPTVRGDRRAVARMKAWTDRAQNA